MKLRLGFVSNSSSSSFMIARDSKLSPRTVIEIELHLADKAEDVLNTQEELDQYFLSKWEGCYSDDSLDTILKEDEYLKELYGRASYAIAIGKVVYVLDVEYHEPEFDAINCNQLKDCEVLNEG